MSKKIRDEEREAVDAKKTVVVQPKKKRNCCCTCLVASLIVFVLVVGAGVGVGWYFGDKFTNQNLDMSLSECLDVVSKLYWEDESKLVKNGYGKSDLDGFYSELKKQLFLSDDVEITAADLVALTKSDTAQAKKNVKFYNAVKDAFALDSAKETAGGETGEETGESPITALIKNLFVKENMDFERLRSYTDGKHDEYLMNISDKGLAAFVNELMKEFLKSDERIINANREYGIDVANSVALSQLTLRRGVRAVSTGGASAEKEVTTISATVRVKVKNLALSAVKKQLAGNGFSWLAEFGVNIAVPTHVFATVEIGLTDDIGVNLYLNNLDTDAEMAKAYKLIKGATGTDVKAELGKAVTESVQPALEKTGIDFSAVSGGKLKLDPFETIIEASGINDGKEEAAKINSRDILTTLRGVATSDPSLALEEDADFRNWYEKADGSGDVYMPAVTDEVNIIDYRKRFLNELSEKYLFDLSGRDKQEGTADDITFDDVMAMFGVGEGAAVIKPEDLIATDRISSVLGTPLSELTVNLDDRMLGAILDAVFASFTDAPDANQIIKSASVAQVLLTEKADSKGNAHNLLELGVYIDLSSVTEGAGEMASVISAFLPERVMISVRLDVTLGMDPALYYPAALKYNDLTEAETQRILDVMNKLSIEGMDTQSLLSQIEKPVREILTSMSDVLPISFSASKFSLPTLFKLMESLLFTEETDGVKTAVVTDSEIKTVLSRLDEAKAADFVTGVMNVMPAADNYDSFVSEIKNKYYLNLAPGANTFDEIFASVDLSSFNASAFDLTALKHDVSPSAALRPEFSDRELAALFVEKMGDATNPDNIYKNLVNVEGIKLEESGADGMITVVIGLNVKSMVPEDKASLLPLDKLYLKARVNLSAAAVKYYDQSTGEDQAAGTPGAVPYYDTDITVNNMSESEFSALNRMINRLAAGGEVFDFAVKAKDIGSLIYDQFALMDSKLGGGLTIVDGGVELMSFYDFVACATLGEGAADGDTVKAAVQGLYPYDSLNPNPNNYDLSAVADNPIYEGNLDVSDIIGASVTGAGVSGSMRDYKFGKLVASKLGSGENAVGTLTDLSILAAADTSAKAAARRGFISSFGTVVDPAKDYMLLVFEMNLSDLGAASENVSAFLPATINVSVAVDLSGNYNPVMFRINALTEAQQQVLFNMAGMSGAQQSINDKLSNLTGVLAGYSAPSFTAEKDSDRGIGTISSTFTF